MRIVLFVVLAYLSMLSAVRSDEAENALLSSLGLGLGFSDTLESFNGSVWEFYSPTGISKAGGGVWLAPPTPLPPLAPWPVNVNFGPATLNTHSQCSGGLAMRVVRDICIKSPPTCLGEKLAGALYQTRGLYGYGTFSVRVQSDHNVDGIGKCTGVTSYFDVFAPKSGKPTINMAWNCDHHRISLVYVAFAIAALLCPASTLVRRAVD
jgi:hypothetical protein